MLMPYSTAALRLDQFRESCGALVDEKEFFIRKAIGWTIRELSEVDAVTAEKLTPDSASTLPKDLLSESTVVSL